MSDVELFVAGTIVTLLVAGALTLLIWGAVLDGREARARAAEDRDARRPAELVPLRDDLHLTDAA